MTCLKIGSLFMGIAGFDLGLSRAGMQTAWGAEIDPACRQVCERHGYGPIYKDVRDVEKETVQPVDLVCGGFPCQDVSVAGRRAGLAGERSGLWFEFHRIIAELLPRFAIIENVPGLLSSNGGQDIQTVIDMLTQIGYTVDIDIKDAQEFGVAQRRRRVFLVCVRLDDLLKRKINLSRQIAADLLAQILLNAWGATRQVSSLVPLHSVYEKPIERCVSLLSKMTGLLEITRERLACKKYQNVLDALLDQFGGEGKNSEFGLIEKLEIQKGGNSDRMAMFPSEQKAENGDTSISLCLNEYLVAVCKTESQFTTSISTNRITDHQIYIFAVMALLIVKRILLSTDWSESCWSVVSTLSILLQENMNYARQASRNLFIESGLRDDWRDYLRSASNIQSEIERHLGAIRERQVLFESESRAWDTPPSRETGTDIANTIATGTNPSRYNPTGGETFAISEIAGYKPGTGTLRANGGDLGGGSEMLITGTLPHDYYKQGGNGMGEMENGLLAWNWQSGGDVRHDFNERPMLQASQVPAVGVRRLTPTECEALQGFPRNWTAGQPDSIRYRQLGNAVTVTVIEWIGKRLVQVEEQE